MKTREIKHGVISKEHSISRNGHEIEKMKTFSPCILHEFPINKYSGAP